MHKLEPGTSSCQYSVVALDIRKSSFYDNIQFDKKKKHVLHDLWQHDIKLVDFDTQELCNIKAWRLQENSVSWTLSHRGARNKAQ